MAKDLMQEHLYGDLLTPTPNYHTDFAMGMTYSLGFDALMTALLAFGMLGDMEDNYVQTPHLLLEAIMKNSDKLVIFCNKGSIAVPPRIQKVYSLLERNIFEVHNSADNTANFHPKLWIIREVSNDNSRDVLMKLIVTSRNMAYSDNIDCIACLTGRVGNSKTRNVKHRRLRRFIEKVVDYSNISDEQSENVLALAKEVERVEKFEVDAPFDDYDFFPYLFKEDFGLPMVEDYLRGTESIIVSPFIDQKLLGRINPNGKHHCALITRKEYVTKDIFDSFKGGVFITLDDLASEGMDLHAKMYLVWIGREKHYLYLGSANATNSAFERNGEFLLGLKFVRGNTRYNQFLKEFYEEGNKDSKFLPLDRPMENATTVIRWDDAERAMKDMMCAPDLKARISRHRDNTFSIRVTSSLKYLKKPVYLAPLQKSDLKIEWTGKAEFEELSADELSEFFIVSSQSEDGKHHESVIRIATEGMPNDRDAAIYNSIIRTKRDFIKFLELMLSDTPVQYLSNEIVLKDQRTGESERGYEFAQVYEKMLRAAAVNPGQILQLGKMLDKLDHETVPEEFRIMYKQFSNALN